MMRALQTLIVSARGQACALPLDTVIETMRPLPIVPLSGQPLFVLGVSVVRGRPTPVLDLGLLFGSRVDRPATRFVSVRTGESHVVLAVAEVRGIHALELERSGDALPASQTRTGLIEGLVTFEGAPLLVLRPARLVSEELWRHMPGVGA